MKRSSALLILAISMVLAGCANTAWIEAQKLAIQADANARVAQAQADAARWTAVAQASTKLDASGAAAVAASAQWSDALGKMTQAQQRPMVIERPRDALDYAEGFARVLGSLGNTAVAWTNIRESNKTQRAAFDRDVRIEEQRQLGESTRSNGRPPTYAFDVQGDSNFGSGILDKSDRRDCRSTAGRGGAGAAAAAPISFGNLTNGAGPLSLASLISAAAAGGGAGGVAMGNC